MIYGWTQMGFRQLAAILQVAFQMHLSDLIFKILIEIPLKFVRKDPIHKKISIGSSKAWRFIAAKKPLSRPMMIQFTPNLNELNPH